MECIGNSFSSNYNRGKYRVLQNNSFTKKEPESGKNCDETSRAGEGKHDDKD